jgi:nucleotidyltransferase/DNA polymerase involved in DNA repair
MQMNLHIATKEEIKNAWAFAASPVRRKRQSMKVRNQAIITACSKEAQILGIRVGMRVQEARERLPELRILVYGRP